MTRFQHQMVVAVYKSRFFLGEGAPQHKHQVLPATGKCFDDIVGDFVPAYIGMRIGFSGDNGKAGVEQQYSLKGPPG